jgi:ferredoxin/flavodoxin---NADP+ reductase
VLLGRRGPAQAAFTNPELRELADLERAGVEVDITDLDLDEASAAWLEAEADPTAKRNVELLRDYAAAEPRADTSHKIVLRFLRSPVEILGEGDDGPVTGVRVVRNEITRNDDGSLRATATDDTETIEAGLVLRSIGYRGKPVDDVPFDERRGLIRNTGGRVCAESGDAHTGEYVVGWIKRGPSGVIGTNKKDSADTTAKIIEDRDNGRLNTPAITDPDAIAAFYAERAPDSVTWAGWEAIDAHEKATGEPHGRPRVKLVRLAELVERSRTTSGSTS